MIVDLYTHVTLVGLFGVVQISLSVSLRPGNLVRSSENAEYKTNNAVFPRLEASS